jgi:hypothetical protein
MTYGGTMDYHFVAGDQNSTLVGQRRHRHHFQHDPLY